MKKLLLAVVLIAISASAHARPGTLPDTMVDTWCSSSPHPGSRTTKDFWAFADDTYERGNQCEGDGITVHRDSYDGPEMGCRFTEVRRITDYAFLVRAHCEGEGLPGWTDDTLFELFDKHLFVKRMPSKDFATNYRRSMRFVRNQVR